MKSHRKERGAAHLIVIVVVVVLLGLLGFVFWQKFINKPAATTAQTSQSSPGNTPKSIKPTLVIENWGVKGNYTDTSVNFVITTDHSSGSNVIDITDSKLANVSGCQDKLAAGYISRFTANEQVDPDGTTAAQAYDAYVKSNNDNNGFFAMAHVGNYYYRYTSPQSTCSTDVSATNVQQAASRAAAAVVKSFAASK